MTNKFQGRSEFIRDSKIQDKLSKLPIHAFRLLIHDNRDMFLLLENRNLEPYMANLQVKSIDDDLYESLGRRAAMENRSISQEVVSILKSYLSTPGHQHKKVNQQFLELCGSWDDERSAEDLVKLVRQDRNRKHSHRDVDF